MKSIIIIASALLIMGSFLTVHPALAGDRVKVYEMAESGITIEFKMTPDEIAAEEAKYLEAAASDKLNNNNPQKRVKVFELGESGIFIAFSMTAEEIAAEDAAKERLAAIRKAKSENQKKHVVAYELAESGISLEFPVETPDRAVPEAVTEKRFLEDLKM